VGATLFTLTVKASSLLKSPLEGLEVQLLGVGFEELYAASEKTYVEGNLLQELTA